MTPAGAAGPAEGGAEGQDGVHSRSREQAGAEQLKEELSVAKAREASCGAIPEALLMLSNVSLSMDLEQGQEPEVVKLKGNPRLIQLLITLRQKATKYN